VEKTGCSGEKGDLFLVGPPPASSRRSIKGGGGNLWGAAAEGKRENARGEKKKRQVNQRGTFRSPCNQLPPWWQQHQSRAKARKGKRRQEGPEGKGGGGQPKKKKKSNGGETGTLSVYRGRTSPYTGKNRAAWKKKLARGKHANQQGGGGYKGKERRSKDFSCAQNILPYEDTQVLQGKDVYLVKGKLERKKTQRGRES